MAEIESNGKTRFGLTAAEYANLMDGVRYATIIVLTVGVTFVIVAVTATALGF